MGRYRIHCVVMENPSKPRSHTNIKKVGVGDKLYGVREIIDFMDRGEKFFTTNQEGKYPRDVIECACGGAGSRHIRSAPDNREDNNLEAQPECR